MALFNKILLSHWNACFIGTDSALFQPETNLRLSSIAHGSFLLSDSHVQNTDFYEVVATELRKHQKRTLDVLLIIKGR